MVTRKLTGKSGSKPAHRAPDRLGALARIRSALPDRIGARQDRPYATPPVSKFVSAKNRGLVRAGAHEEGV